MTLITKPDFTYVWASGGAVVAPNDAKKQLGWVAEAPPFQYDNWLQNRQDQMLAHINQRGIPAWDGLTNYEAGGLSYVQGSDGKVYKSVAASGPSSVVSNPTTDGTDTYWTIAFADVGAFLTQAAGDTRYTQRSNNLSDLTNVATARTNLGAAPLASPAFTGTPTAPTASPGTNTTQLATTAFVLDAGGLNTPLVTLSAAGTINLTTGAPATSQLAISGTGVSINGFTVAANRFFVVKMTGVSNTLVNSASLVTGRGANIPVVAGDSFLMRSTSANTVEVVCGDFLADRGIGSGQTWQNVTGSRVSGTTYTNTTGRSIVIQLWPAAAPSSTATITVAGELVAHYSTNNTVAGANGTVSAIIPAGATYSYAVTVAAVLKVVELR